MSVRPIILHADNADLLRKPSLSAERNASQMRELLTDLKDTLTDQPSAVGLAAPQIGVHQRIIAIRLGGIAGDWGPPMTVINPVVLNASRVEPEIDGCLSYPGCYAETMRPHLLHLCGFDEQGSPLELRLEAFDAVVAHHQVDHLDGILFTDRRANAYGSLNQPLIWH